MPGHIKQGARHSAADNKLLQAIHDNALALGAMCPDAKAVDVAALREGLGKLSARYQSVKGLDYAGLDAWDVQNGAQALAVLAGIASSEAAQGEAAHVLEVAGLLRGLLAWLGAEVDELAQAASQPEPDAKRLEETLVCAGEAVKALGGGKIGGYLVRFGDANTPDLSEMRDWFHVKTYFGARDGDGVDVTMNHGIPLKRGLEEYANRLLPPVKTRKDKLGVFAETVMDLSDEYEKLVYDLAEAGKLKWSSGAVSHLVKRVRLPNGTHRVDQWIIGEAALTPTPAEPRDTQVRSLKALVTEQAGQPEPEGSAVDRALGIHAPDEWDDLIEAGRALTARFREG